MNFTHLLVKFIGGPEEAPASGGLRAGSAALQKLAGALNEAFWSVMYKKNRTAEYNPSAALSIFCS